jgi:hypothetical protein
MKTRLMLSLAVGALLTTLLPSLATADTVTVPGRPGGCEVEIHIGYQAPGGGVGEGGFCWARYHVIVNGNEYIGEGDSGYADVRVMDKGKGATAVCETLDLTTWQEATTEVGYTTSECSLTTAEGTWADGSGQVTALGKPTVDGVTDRRVRMTCRFDADDFTPYGP